jgi:hypothetical protein
MNPGETSGLFTRSTYSSRIAEMVDGTSTTIMAGEVRPFCSDHIYNGWFHNNSIWTAVTAPINFRTCTLAEDRALTACINRWDSWNTSQGFKSRHEGGAHFLIGDGAVRFISENIDYETYQRLGDRRDGYPVGEF